MFVLWQVMDMLVEQTHEIRHELRQNDKAMRYTDTRLDEQDRGISVKMVPMSLLLPSSSGKSFLFNLIDTPGTSEPRGAEEIAAVDWGMLLMF